MVGTRLGSRDAVGDVNCQTQVCGRVHGGTTEEVERAPVSKVRGVVRATAEMVETEAREASVAREGVDVAMVG